LIHTSCIFESMTGSVWIGLGELMRLNQGRIKEDLHAVH
jgi:hypothetical protein